MTSANASNDDWRVHVRLHEQGLAHALKERLGAADLEHNLEQAFEDKVIVSIDGGELYCYAGSREQAEAVAALIRKVGADHDPDISLSRWHPSAQAWEDADAPLPATNAEVLAERGERIARERAESEGQGYPEYEVRVQAADRDQAELIASRLARAGLRSVQRAHYLLLGAEDEDTASALADQVRDLAGQGVSVTTEATGRAIQDGIPPNPLAIFGGLAG